MKYLKFYKYAALALLLLNVSMVAFFFLRKPNRPHQGRNNRFQERAINVLKLDKQQHALFLQSAKRHSRKMDSINLEQHNLLTPYFQSLISDSIASGSEAILSKVQQLERDKVESTYHHFKEVKSILKPSQMPDFKVFMRNVLERILLNQKKKPPPPKES